MLFILYYLLFALISSRFRNITKYLIIFNSFFTFLFLLLYVFKKVVQSCSRLVLLQYAVGYVAIFKNRGKRDILEEGLGSAK